MDKKQGLFITRRDGSTVRIPGRGDLEKMIDESGLGVAAEDAVGNPMALLAAMQRLSAMGGLGRPARFPEADMTDPANDESMEP